MLKKLLKSSVLAVFVAGVAFAGDVPNEVRDFMKFANKEAWETHLATIIQERKAQNLEFSPLLNDEKSWVWKSIGKSLSEIGTKSGIYKQDEIIDIRQKENWSTYTKDDCRDLLLRNIANFTCATPGEINDILSCLDDVVESLKSSEKYGKTCKLDNLQGDKFEANLDVAVFEVKNFATELKLKDYLNRMRDINGRQKMVNFANEMTNSDLPYAYFDLEEVAPDVKACFAYLKKMPNNDGSKKPPRIAGYVQFEKFMVSSILRDSDLRLRRYVLDKPLQKTEEVGKKCLSFFLRTGCLYSFSPRWQVVTIYEGKALPSLSGRLAKGHDAMQALSWIEQDLSDFAKKKADGKLLNDIIQKSMNSLINRIHYFRQESELGRYPRLPNFQLTSWDGKSSTYDAKLAECLNLLNVLKNSVKLSMKCNECDLVGSINNFLGTAKQGGSRERRRVVNPGIDFFETPREYQIVRYDSKLKFFHDFRCALDLVGDNIRHFQGEW